VTTATASLLISFVVPQMVHVTTHGNTAIIDHNAPVVITGANCVDETPMKKVCEIVGEFTVIAE
jgi:hypothetical protein